MDTPFIPYSLSILALFTDSDAWYQVPSYQRHYKWEDEHVEKLWDNLVESWKSNPEGSYFLGSIITSKPKHKTRYFDIVDGQQRLATLTILLCVVRDRHPNFNKKIDDTYAITVNNIKDAIQSNDGNDRFLLQPKFTPDDSSKTDFEQTIIAKDSTKEIERKQKELVLANKWDIKGDNPKCRFINSALILSKRIKEIEDTGEDMLSEFINYLFNNVQVIRIDCKEDSFAVRLFQVINTTGLDLSGSDLIKSFLFREIANLTNIDKGLLDNKKNQFMNDWVKVEEIASACLTNADDMLTLYLYYTCGQTAKTSLFDDLKEAFEKQLNEKKPTQRKEPTQIMGDIIKFVENYEDRIIDAKDKVIFSLRYIPWENLWRSILLTAMHTNYPDTDELAKELRRFYYLNWIAGKTLRQVKKTSFDVINNIKKGESIENIAKTLRNEVIKNKKVDVIKDAISNLLSPTAAEQKWAKSLLLLLEYDTTDDSMLVFIELRKKLHLEHIFPKNPSSGWEHIDKSVADKYLNSVGNITLLSGKKNIKASNKPFAEKIKAYNGKGLEKSNPGVTAFDITKKIVSDYEAKIYKEKWDKKAMGARKDWFLDGIAKLLDIEKELADYKPDS